MTGKQCLHFVWERLRHKCMCSKLCIHDMCWQGNVGTLPDSACCMNVCVPKGPIYVCMICVDKETWTLCLRALAAWKYVFWRACSSRALAYQYMCCVENETTALCVRVLAAWKYVFWRACSSRALAYQYMCCVENETTALCVRVLAAWKYVFWRACSSRALAYLYKRMQHDCACSNHCTCSDLSVYADGMCSDEKGTPVLCLERFGHDCVCLNLCMHVLYGERSNSIRLRALWACLLYNYVVFESMTCAVSRNLTTALCVRALVTWVNVLSSLYTRAVLERSNCALHSWWVSECLWHECTCPHLCIHVLCFERNVCTHCESACGMHIVKLYLGVCTFPL